MRTRCDFDHHHAGGRAGFLRRFGGFMGGGQGFRAARMLGSGDLQLIILALLEEKPRHGYEIIKALEERVGGGYSPSPGVVYPNLTLRAEGGFESSTLKHLFDWPSRFWSVGPSVSETIFDAGLRRATVNQYIATYNGDVATYRQTVLTAFQQVEDDLAEVRILGDQIQQQRQAEQSAKKYVELEMARYDTGVDP